MDASTHAQETPSPLATLVGAAALMLVSLAALIPGLVPPPNATEIAAVYPPWWTAARVVTVAGHSAELLRMGAAPNIVIVRTRLPGTRSRLRADGAVMFLNPIVGACAPGRTV